MKILVLNGPNMNLLGLREPEIYGQETYEDLVSLAEQTCREAGLECICVQSNHEGVLIDENSKGPGRLRRHRHQSRRILPHQHRHSRCPAGGGSPCRGGAYLRPGKAGALPPHFLHRHGLPQGHQGKRAGRLPGGHPLSEGAGGKVVFPVDEWPPQWYNACADKAMGKGGREAP